MLIGILIVNAGINMRYIPEHVLQAGGTVPINTPLMEQTNLTPLIQVASIPVDSGVRTALELRQQQLYRDNLELQREEFEWRREKWEEEFDLRKQEYKANNTLTLLSMYDKMVRGQMETGAPGGTGLPSNFHTPGQLKARSDVTVAKHERVAEFMDSIHGNIANIDPAEYFRVGADLAKLEGDSYQRALAQATAHHQQMEAYKKTPGDYDAELFTYNLLKYSDSQDIDEEYNMLHPSLSKAAKDAFEANKDKWGIAQEVQYDDGIKIFFQENPDIRKEFAQEIVTGHSATLAAKYQMLKDLSSQGKAPDPGDFQTWAADYVEGVANTFLSPSYKAVGSPIKPDAKTTKDEGASLSPIYTPETNTAGWVSAVDANVPIPIDIDIHGIFKADTPASKWKPSETLGTFGSDISSSDSIVHLPLTPTEKSQVEIAAKALYEGGAQAELTKWIDGEGILTEEGRKGLKEYRDKFKEKITQGVSLIQWQDIKDDGVISNAPGSKEAVNNFFTNYTGVTMMNLSNGEMMTGEDFIKKYSADFDNDINKMKEAMNIPGIIDPRNILQMVAQGGNQIADPSFMGAAPYYATMIDKKGRTQRFAMKREDQWLQSAAGKTYRAGNMFYTDAVSGLGTQVPFNEKAFEMAISTLPGATPEEKKRILDNMQGVRLNQYETEDGRRENIVFEYGNNASEVANGKLEIAEPYTIPTGFAILDHLTSNLGADHDVLVTQGRNPNNGAMGWVIKIDDQDAFAVTQGSPEQNANMKLMLNQAIMDTKGGGRDNAALYFKNAVFDQTVDPRVSKQFIDDWSKHMDPILPPGYKITSAFRFGDPTAGKGRTIDLTGRDDTLTSWFQTHVPGLTKTGGTKVEHYQIPGTPFAVAWHQNMQLIRDNAGNVVEKRPVSGYHFDIKYSNEANLK